MKPPPAESAPTTVAAAIDLEELQVRHAGNTPGAMMALSQVVAKTMRVHAPNPVQATGCAVTGFVDLLLGRYLAYIAHIKRWDLAGCLPMLAAHGYDGFFADGKPLTTAVNVAAYALHPDDKKRFCLRGGCLFTQPQLAVELWKCFKE